MLRIATDWRCSADLADIRERWTIADVMDTVDVLDLRDEVEAQRDDR